MDGYPWMNSRGENIYVAYCAIEGVMLARVPAEGFCGEAVKNAVTYEEMFDGCLSFIFNKEMMEGEIS